MLINFFFHVKQFSIPVTIRELLDLIQCLKNYQAFASLDEFYHLSRLCLVKNEKHYHKFDMAFDTYIKGLDHLDDLLKEILEKKLNKEINEHFSSQLNQLIKENPSLMRELEQALAQENDKNKNQNNAQIDNRNPQNTMEGNGLPKQKKQKGTRQIWQKKTYKDLDHELELGTRNIKIALRRLRELKKSGSWNFDLTQTIDATAKHAGLLDIKMQRETKNDIKILLFFDIGGSMDPYIQLCEELFSAAHSEFKHLEYFYFHNFIYDSVWKTNLRNRSSYLSLNDIFQKYNQNYRIIFVGDATMSPYEITHIGGSTEYWNEEPGAVWMKRMVDRYPHLVWLNPTPKDMWSYQESIIMTQELIEKRMFPLSIDGISDAMQSLKK